MAPREMKVESYKKLTAIAKARLATIYEAVQEMERQQTPLTPVQHRKLSGFLIEMKKKKADFEVNMNRLIESDVADIAEIDFTKDVDEITDLYLNAASIIEVLTEPENPTTPSADSETSGLPLQVACGVRLPKLDLPSFNGEASKWVSYINMYDSAIHKNMTLSNVSKLQYLLSSLTGEPLNLIKSLSLSAPNYLIAYNLLRERYHNDRRLCTLHLNKILDLPSVSQNSVKQMRFFVNTFYENTESLKALNCDISTEVNPLLSAHLLRKLDHSLLSQLEQYRATLEDHEEHKLPTVKEIIQFLNTTCAHHEDASLHTSKQDSYPVASNFRDKSRRSNFTSNPKTGTTKHVAMLAATNTADQSKNRPTKYGACFACQGSHSIYKCDAFRKMKPFDRAQMVKKHQICNSCLGKHATKDCKSTFSCLVCQNRHHSMLHYDKASLSNKPTNNRSPVPPVTTTTTNELPSTSLAASALHPIKTGNSTVLLGTALVKVTTTTGNIQVLRCLLDSGSQLSFISERAAQLLRSPRIHAPQEIVGISATPCKTKGVTYLNLASLSDHLIAAQHPLHILDRISADLPRVHLDPQVWEYTRPYVLADPTFDQPGGVDMLIGGALYPALLTQQTKALGQGLPHLVGTHLGWVVMGLAPCLETSPPAAYHVALHSVAHEDTLHTALQRFWVQEDLPPCSKKTEEELHCDDNFRSTHSRDADGRYVVRLPFTKNHPPLGTSYKPAEKRFNSLETKLKGNNQFKKLYVDFMTEYKDLGHMVLRPEPKWNFPHYVLPHHGVFKAHSDTPKIRTVFDASAKTSNGISLNDVLLTGPKLQNNICDILLQFRLHSIVLSCDIRQMYRQIKVHQDDQPFQRILWREDPALPISVYELTTVTYGLNSSPYLAIKTLHQLAEDEGSKFPRAADILKHQSYVDDIIFGASTEETAQELQGQLISLLQLGGFELRKWISNSPGLLQGLPADHREAPVFLQQSSDPHFSILGLHWSPTSDSFNYHLDVNAESPTKRKILSFIAKIYDPCGFLSPCTMTAKCLMQLLWTSGQNWDEPLPTELSQKWQTFVTDLKQVSMITIPRPLNISQSHGHLELHGFADASENGYAAVVYLRSETNEGSVHVSLLLSKTRVAPLKRVTLPRLELCAAHLLSSLTHYCKTQLERALCISSIHLWSDSTVALSWIQAPPYRLKTYVANRVAQIQEYFPTHCWRHIQSTYNPADCASRGILPTQLLDHPLWWTGPTWLQLPSSEWPISKFVPEDISSMEEVKTIPLTVLNVTSQEPWDFITKFSSWPRLQRVTAYLSRFIHNLRHQDKRHGFLSIQELREATKLVCKLVQATAFPEDLSLLKKGSPSTSQLRRLCPILSTDGLIRVGGRLQGATSPYEAKHPIVLPKKHELVNLLIDHFHQIHLHSGPQLTQALLCQHFWILSARQVIRSRIFKCVTCFRNKPRNVAPMMADLPSARVTPSKPFSSTGCDYCGPFMAKLHNLRGNRLVKVYICVFVCLATKAVHLEVVTDLTTEAFIAALVRFSSRRGLPTHLYSDCGTNFIGADKVLRNLLKSSLDTSDAREKIHLYASQEGINFHFNAPASPHMGGLWESAVKSIKHHLRRTMGETSLSLMELITLSTQIEAILNSRPLTTLSNDPSDLTALTPGHFLTGAPLRAVPEPDLQDLPLNRLSRWQLVMSFHQKIWRRWQLEYLHTLQQRSKWTTATKSLQVGDLVLIHANTPPLTWPLARVTALHPGPDGVVRVVDVKTSTGTLTRPVVKLFPLPKDEV